MLEAMGTTAQRLADIAAPQRNLVTLADILTCGGGEDYAALRVARGEWQRLHSSVFLTAPAPPDFETRVLAACLRAGPTARASHRTAAALLGLDGAPKGPIEITVAHANCPRPRGVIVHRTTRLDPSEMTTLRGIPISSVDRLLVDYGAVVPARLVERALEDAIDRALTTAVRAARKLAQVGGPGCRGSGVLRAVLARRLDGGPAGSYLEILAAHELVEAGLTGWVRQFLLPVGGGEKYKLDLALPGRKVAVEPQGRKGHRTRSERAYDERRRQTLAALGWIVIIAPWDEVVNHPGRFVARVRAALHAAAA